MKISSYLKSYSLCLGSPENWVCFQAQNIFGNKRMTVQCNLAKFISPGLMHVSHRRPRIFPQQAKLLLLSRISGFIALL